MKKITVMQVYHDIFLLFFGHYGVDILNLTEWGNGKSYLLMIDGFQLSGFNNKCVRFSTSIKSTLSQIQNRYLI